MPVRPRGHRFPGLAATTLVCTLTLGAALAGCSASEGSSADATSSRSGSPSPAASESGSPTGSPTGSPSGTSSGSSSDSPSASPTPRPPKVPRAAKDTVAARKAFASSVVARWGYALRTDDATAVTGLSPKNHPCQGCKDFATELGKRRKQRWYVDFPGAKVRSVTVSPSSAPHTYLAHVKVDIPASRSFFRNGSFRNDNPAHRGATFDVRMAYSGKAYRLLAFQVR